MSASHKLILVLAILLLFPIMANSQSISIAGTVIDTPDNQVWANGKITFTFSGAIGTSYTWTGGTLNPNALITATLNSSGAYSASIPDNLQINPGGSQWKVTVCPQMQNGGCYITYQTITAANTTLNITPPSPRINVPLTPQAIGPIQAYANSEIVGGWIGFSYYNVTTSSSQVCSTVSSTGCTIWTGGGSSNLTSDNTFTNNNRFKGPIPWRDVTSYMPAGGCSSTTPVNGADTTGTISSGQATLTLAAARDFKNGCGIAVQGAGPTSTLAAPTLSASPTSASRSGQTVTMVFSGTPLTTISFGTVGTGEAVSVTGCSVGAYNAFAEVQSLTVGGGNTTITYNVASSASDSATSCLATFIYGSVHGVAGSTMYKYQLVKCDINQGCSPASSTLTITNANATLTKNNYNYIAYPFDTNAAIWLLYSDKGLGGALTCVNASVTMAMIDIGGYNPCPPYAPMNPPVSATAQALYTTISSGSSTTILTLANTASNNATAQSVYHDESGFLNSCITDANNDQPNTGVGAAGYGCYIPAGVYGINGPLRTATTSANGSLNIYVSGLLNFQTQPWQILKSGYQIIGVGGGAQGGTVGQKKPMTAIKFGPNVPYGFVFGTASFQTSAKGFQMQYVNGTGIFIGATNPSNGTSGVSIEDITIVEQGSSGNAPCVTIDDNNIGIWMTNVSCQANQAVGGMPCVYITHTPSGSFVNQILRNNGVHCTFHGWKFDGPGGQNAGASIHDIMYQDSFTENLPNADVGQFEVDGQVNGLSTGGWALQGISLDHLISSDASSGATFVQMSPTSANNMPISAVEIKNSYLSGIPATCAVVTNCQQYPISGVSSSGVGFAFMPSGQTGIVAGNSQDTYFGTRLGIVPGTANYGASPATDMPFKIYLVPPGANNINSTGAGSLAAGVYCASFTGLDANSYETGATGVNCQTVGASSSIKYDFAGNGNTTNFYSGYNFYYCFTASGTCSPGQKFSSISTSSDGGNGLFFTFTTTAGSSAATPPSQGTAMLSWLSQTPTNAPFACFYCSSSGSDAWPIGIGMLPTPNTGYNLYTKLGVNVGGKVNGGSYATGTNCSGTGTAANPSVASCGSSAAGSFSCATNASTGTCQVNTTAVTANSQIFVQEDDSLGTKLGVTCNTNNVLPASAPLLGARSGATSFTINLGTFTTNPLCFSFFIMN